MFDPMVFRLVLWALLAIVSAREDRGCLAVRPNAIRQHRLKCGCGCDEKGVSLCWFGAFNAVVALIGVGMMVGFVLTRL